MVEALIDAGASVDFQDGSRANALLATGETGNVEILRAVLRANPDLTRTNRFGGTALIPAADRGHVEVIRELVGSGIDLDHVNDLGGQRLLEAMNLGDGGAAHREIVQILVDAGADIGIADRGMTPLEHARRSGYDEIARILAKVGTPRWRGPLATLDRLQPEPRRQVLELGCTSPAIVRVNCASSSIACTRSAEAFGSALASTFPTSWSPSSPSRAK